MKKLLLMTCGLWLASSLSAQQLPNPGFEDGWGDCTPWTSNNNTSTIGRQPGSWKISHVIGIGGTGKTEVGSEEAAGHTGKCVKLINTANAFRKSEIVPAYLTLGTPWSCSVATISSVSHKDGGTFGGISFTRRPDAVSFWAKREHGSGSTQPFTVVAYAWKGSTSQADVPGNLVLDLFGTGSSKMTNCTMVNRERNIFDIATSEGGYASHSSDFQLIAWLNNNDHKEAIADWTKITMPLTYQSNEIPEQFNIIFAANDYFMSSGMVGGDALYVDDVVLEYWNKLSAVKVDGVAVTDFDPEVLSYEITGVRPDLTQVTYTKVGQAAVVTPAVNTANNSIDLTVTNADDSSVAARTYSLKFSDVPSSITDAMAAEAETEYYDLQGRRVLSPTHGLYLQKCGNQVKKVIK